MPFTHTPIPPTVSNDYPTQRWFRGNTDNSGVHVPGCDSSYANVYRDGKTDVAELRLESIGAAARFSVRMGFEPAQLREIAQRLLDAAADIEANPAS